MNPTNANPVAILACAVALTWLAADARGEIVDFGDNEVPTRAAELVDDSDLGGKSARFDGVVTESGQRLVLTGLDIMSPLVVQVFAKDSGMPVDVSLHRYFWGKPDAEGSTGSSGEWAFQGRAHDEVGIALKTPSPTPVYVLMWQGPAVPAAPAPLVITDSARDSGKAEAAGGGNVLMLVVIGLLAVIALLLAWQLFRRRPGAAAMILVAWSMALLGANGEAFAQSSQDPPSNPFSKDEDPGKDFQPEDLGPKPEDDGPSGDSPPKPDPDKPAEPTSAPKPDPDKPAEPASPPKPDPDADKPGDTGSKLKPDPVADKPGDPGSKLKPDPDADKPGDSGSKLKPDPDKPTDGDAKPKPDPDKDKPADGDSKLKPGEDGSPSDDVRSGSMDDGDSTSSGDTGAGSDRSFDERLENAYEQIRQLRDEVASNSARIRNLEFLINQDREAVPAPGDGAPPMTVSCDDDPACQACLARANEELSDLLVNLDKLRIIYSSYMRYRDYMVGLGDSISGFHQLEQAAWYRVKLQIEQATVNLQGAYDAKFDEYKVRLSNSLRTLSACNSVDGDPVFSRESVLFENYVKAKYARDQ